jgi:preprotein translocase subunit Sec63
MSKYDEIIAARDLLGLPEKASLEEIKVIYRNLMRKWHPDTCVEEKEKCKEMTQKIIAAYDIILKYCHQYKISFQDEEIKNYLSDEDWWFERFGSDPLWGKR